MRKYNCLNNTFPENILPENVIYIKYNLFKYRSYYERINERYNKTEPNRRRGQNCVKVKCYNFFDRANSLHLPPICKLPPVCTILFTCHTDALSERE